MNDELHVWNISFKESECYVNDYKNQPLRDKQIELLIANQRNDIDSWPWYETLTFSSRKDWSDFVKLVNRENNRIKKSARDEQGFPIFDTSE